MSSASSTVLVLAATNCPWDLDEAARRRLEKRIYVGLPSHEDRIEQFRLLLNDLSVEESVTPETLADMLPSNKCYSFADIHTLCREAAMSPVRRLLACKTVEEIKSMRSSHQLDRAPVVLFDDFLAAATVTKPTCDEAMLDKYESWNSIFGSS